jgi:hypothetical protein
MPASFTILTAFSPSAAVRFFLIFFNVLVGDVIHTQTCSSISSDPKKSCQEEVTEQAKNCKYVFLFWQKVEPSQKDIDACIKYRQQNENSQNN